jgi:hypothetical protein
MDDDEWMDGWILRWMDGSLARTTKKTKKIASCETFCRLSNHNIVRTFTLSKMNVRKSAIRAMNRCLSVAIPLGAILFLASAQGGTFHRPVRAILFQFHLLLPRPTGGRSSRLDSSSEVLPRSRGKLPFASKKWSQAASFGSYTLYPTPCGACGVLACPESSVSPEAPSPPFSQGAPGRRSVLSWPSRGLKSLISDKNSYVHLACSLARLLAHSQPNPDARRDRWRSSSSVAPIWSRTSTRWPATLRRTPSPVLTLSGATSRPLTPSPVRSLAATPACWRT